MIRINLGRRKRAGGGSGAGDMLGEILGKLGIKGKDGEAKKFDFKGPIPKVAMGIVAAMMTEDHLNGLKEEDLKRVGKQIESVEKEKGKLESELAKIKGFEPMKKQLEDDEKAIRLKLEVVNKLLDNRNAPARMLMQIAQAIPEEIWLTHVTVNKDTVNLRGATPGYSQVSDFINALNTSGQLGEIALSGIEESKGDKKEQQIQTFELKALRRQGE